MSRRGGLGRPSYASAAWAHAGGRGGMVALLRDLRLLFLIYLLPSFLTSSHPSFNPFLHPLFHPAFLPLTLSFFLSYFSPPPRPLCSLNMTVSFIHSYFFLLLYTRPPPIVISAARAVLSVRRVNERKRALQEGAMAHDEEAELFLRSSVTVSLRR